MCRGGRGHRSFLGCFFLIVVIHILICVPHITAVRLEVDDSLILMLRGAVAQHLLRGHLHLRLLQAPLWLVDAPLISPDPIPQVGQVAVTVPGILGEEDIGKDVPINEEVVGQGAEEVP